MKELQARRIRPVDVIDRQERPVPCGDGVDQAGQRLVQPPLGCRRAGAIPYLGNLGEPVTKLGKEPGGLGQPRRTKTFEFGMLKRARERLRDRGLGHRLLDLVAFGEEFLRTTRPRVLRRRRVFLLHRCRFPFGVVLWHVQVLPRSARHE